MKNSSINYLHETLGRHTEKICVIEEKKSLTFKEFYIEAVRLCRVIGKGGINNKPVIVYLPKSVEAIVSFASILLSGNIYVPLDVKSPLSRTARILESTNPWRVITSKFFEKQVRSLGVDLERIIYLEDIKRVDSDEPIEALIKECEQRTASIIDLDPCYIINTSGSTGTPKGVVISHRGVMDYIDWAISFLQVSEHDIIGNQAPLFFDNSVLDIYLSWSTGATLDLIPETLFSFPIRLIEYLEEHQVTFIFFVPSILVNIANMKVLSPGRLSKLKKVVFAGEIMPTRYLAYWQENLPDKIYINLYGPTEITVDCTYFVVDRIYGANEVLPIGYPRPNSGIIILDDNNQVAKAGEIGELCVRGSCLALGYWNDRGNTERAFVQNPLQNEFFDQIYRTGDLAYLNDKQQIIFVGRKDNQIKHMGYRIELGEIELAATSLPFVNRCCAVYNSEKKEIVLFYESDEEVSADMIRTQLSLKIPSYMIPKKCVYLKKLPLNPSGKIDRKLLSDEIG
jgi:amino acid adenylation domain-containing protein